MPVQDPQNNPRKLYLLCRNNGYDVNNPDPAAPNEPDLSPPDPEDPNYYHNTQVLSYIWVADNTQSGDGANHSHWMSSPYNSGPSHNLALTDGHTHNSSVGQAGNQHWSTERVNGLPPHSHEVDVMQITTSLGDQGMLLRPKWAFCLSSVNEWTWGHWDANGGGRTIMIAERPYISGDDADPATWVFEDKPENIPWDSGYRNQIDSFFLSRFGLSLPDDDGSGDVGVENDRNLIQWWHSINGYQFTDESRFG